MKYSQHSFEGTQLIHIPLKMCPFHFFGDNVIQKRDIKTTTPVCIQQATDPHTAMGRQVWLIDFAPCFSFTTRLALSSYSRMTTNGSDEFFEATSHAEQTFRKMETYLQHKQLCDVLLIAGDHKIPAHRLVGWRGLLSAVMWCDEWLPASAWTRRWGSSFGWTSLRLSMHSFVTTDKRSLGHSQPVWVGEGEKNQQVITEHHQREQARECERERVNEREERKRQCPLVCSFLLKAAKTNLNRFVFNLPSLNLYVQWFCICWVGFHAITLPPFSHHHAMSEETLGAT